MKSSTEALTRFSPRSGKGAQPPALGARIVLWVIRGYQVLVSPLLGPRCRFYPTCSQYAAEAISRHGISKGALLSAKRLLKCHPFHPGGVDPVP